jgi:hypothetical protein
MLHQCRDNVEAKEFHIQECALIVDGVASVKHHHASVITSVNIATAIARAFSQKLMEHFTTQNLPRSFMQPQFLAFAFFVFASEKAQKHAQSQDFAHKVAHFKEKFKDRPKYGLAIEPETFVQLTENLQKMFHPIMFSGQALLGSYLDMVAWIIKHDCTPNAIVFFETGKRLVQVRAIRDIAPGEEITISKVDETLSWPVRSATNIEVCNCPRCKVESYNLSAMSRVTKPEYLDRFSKTQVHIYMFALLKEKVEHNLEEAIDEFENRIQERVNS